METVEKDQTFLDGFITGYKRAQSDYGLEDDKIGDDTKRLLKMLNNACKGYCGICQFKHNLDSDTDCILLDYAMLEERLSKYKE